MVEGKGVEGVRLDSEARETMNPYTAPVCTVSRVDDGEGESPGPITGTL